MKLREFPVTTDIDRKRQQSKVKNPRAAVRNRFTAPSLSRSKSGWLRRRLTGSTLLAAIGIPRLTGREASCPVRTMMP